MKPQELAMFQQMGLTAAASHEQQVMLPAMGANAPAAARMPTRPDSLAALQKSLAAENQTIRDESLFIKSFAKDNAAVQRTLQTPSVVEHVAKRNAGFDENFGVVGGGVDKINPQQFKETLARISPRDAENMRRAIDRFDGFCQKLERNSPTQAQTIREQYAEGAGMLKDVVQQRFDQLATERQLTSGTPQVQKTHKL